MKSNIVEVSFDLNDRNIYFRPFGATLRGRKDFVRMAKHDIELMLLSTDFPRGVPSTLLRIDLGEGTVELVEPLRTEEWAPEREKIEARGIVIPHNIKIDRPHIPDWLWEVRRCLNFGYAKIVNGDMPRDLGSETVEKREKSGEERVEDRFKSLCDVFEGMLMQFKDALGK